MKKITFLVQVTGAKKQAVMRRRTFLRRSAMTVGALAGMHGLRSVMAAADKSYPPARAVTSGPRHHFFGYYDKTPWDATGRYLLAMETNFAGRQPKPGEPLTVGMVDLKDDNTYIPLDTTRAWCWQQGTMLQWLGSAPDREVVYNSVKGDRYVATIRNVHSGRMRTLPRPVYAVSRDGKQAVSLDFDRVNRLRPGYGYLALPERYKDNPAPADAGIYHVDLTTGRNGLIIPLAWAAGHKPDDRFAGAEHWFNHLQFNLTGTRFLFLHRWRSPTRNSWWTRLYTANTDGSGIRLLSDTGMVSHFDWRDNYTILVWTRTKEHGYHFYLIDDRTSEHTVLGDGVLTADGHCSYSPDRKWILNDLMLYRPADNRRVDIGRFHMPPAWAHKPWRCDWHPRWSRDGKQVCFDGAFESTRQVYVIDVGDITKG